MTFNYNFKRPVDTFTICGFTIFVEKEMKFNVGKLQGDHFKCLTAEISLLKTKKHLFRC